MGKSWGEQSSITVTLPVLYTVLHALPPAHGVQCTPALLPAQILVSKWKKMAGGITRSCHKTLLPLRFLSLSVSSSSCPLVPRLPAHRVPQELPLTSQRPLAYSPSGLHPHTAHSSSSLHNTPLPILHPPQVSSPPSAPSPRVSVPLAFFQGPCMQGFFLPTHYSTSQARWPFGQL